jgi:hypothetical protein
VSANGARARLTRDIGNVVMDLGGLEQIDHNALGGADTLAVHELTTTALTRVTTNLASVSGTGDGGADQVIVDGTDSADHVAVAGSSGAATVTGLAATVAIRGAEGAHDNLTIRTRAGADTVDSSALAAGTIGLTVIQ